VYSEPSVGLLFLLCLRERVSLLGLLGSRLPPLCFFLFVFPPLPRSLFLSPSSLGADQRFSPNFSPFEGSLARRHFGPFFGFFYLKIYQAPCSPRVPSLFPSPPLGVLRAAFAPPPRKSLPLFFLVFPWLFPQPLSL